MNIQNAALDYLQRGWPITLCAGKDMKAPIADEWQTKQYSPGEVLAEFTRQPALNVGVRFGPGSCIDIEADDAEQEQAFQKLFDGCDIPRTPSFKSRRGIHRLFAWSEVLAVPNKAVINFDGLGIRVGANGKGAHSLFPPSANTDGTAREWIVSPDDCDLAPLPDLVLRRILEANKPEPPAPPPRANVPASADSKIEQARRYLAKMPGAIEGQHGDDRTFHVACVLVLDFDLTPNEAWPLFCDWNLTCDPPWDEKRLRRKLDEADKQAGERGTKLRNHLATVATSNRKSGSPKEFGDQSHDGEQLITVISSDEQAAELPDVQLPGGGVTITATAKALGELMAATGEFFSRGGAVVRLVNDENNQPQLKVARPAAMCSDFERVARLVKMRKTEEGFEIVPAICSESTAKAILESAALAEALPAIEVLTRCPVLVERGGQLVQICGFDRDSKILAGGQPVDEVDLQSAVRLLSGLVDEYKFATSGDKARALAAIITPALVFSGLLKGRSPVDLAEADQSQSGKGYRLKITAAVYNSAQRTVTQRTGGVGSVQESFDSKLVAGASFVSFDNFRGRLDLPGLESFLTEDSYAARVPYGSPLEIDPRRIVVAMTSNRAEMPIDLANRSSCVRILKQPEGHVFRSYPEGDLLDHVRGNQPRYLGAVFSVIREWHTRGKPQLESVNHDFRRWARVLGYIAADILGAGDLLQGHRAAQERISSPGLTWLRDVALAVLKAKRAGHWLRANQLLPIVTEAGIEDEDSDTDDHDAWLKATRKLGAKLARQFKGNDEIAIDNVRIERRESIDEQYRSRAEYAFSSETPSAPSNPQVTPEVKARNPEAPEPLSHITYARAREQLECSEPLRGLGGGSGETTFDPWESGIEPPPL